MKNKLEYRIENGSLIIDNYFNNLKIGSINGGSVENILNKCKLYDEEYETLLKENEYMKPIAKDFEQLQQENKQLKDNWNKLKELFDIQKGSEEYEALQWLEFQTTNYKNDSIILHFYRILYNFILKLQLENKKFKKLKNNWDELKKYLHNVDVVVDYSENYDGHFINCDELIDKMQELESRCK